MELKCPNPECKWTWNYTGKKTYPAWVACPNCLRRVKLPNDDDNIVPLRTSLLRNDEAIEILKTRLHNGWVFISGDMELISRFEQHVYTPGSGKNKYFEMIGFPHTVFIGKKTEDFANGVGNPPDIDNILAIILHEPSTISGILAEIISSTPENMDASIDELVKRATSRWTDVK